MLGALFTLAGAVVSDKSKVQKSLKILQGISLYYVVIATAIAFVFWLFSRIIGGPLSDWWTIVVGAILLIFAIWFWSKLSIKVREMRKADNKQKIDENMVKKIRDYVNKISGMGGTEKQEMKDEVFADLLNLLHGMRRQISKLLLLFTHKFFKWLVISIPVYLALWGLLKLWWPEAFKYIYPTSRNIIAAFGVYVIATTISSSLVIDLDRAKRTIDNMDGNRAEQVDDNTDTKVSKTGMVVGMLLFFFLCPYFLLNFLEKELGSMNFNEADFVFKYKNEKGNGALPSDFQGFIDNIFVRVKDEELEIRSICCLTKTITEPEELIRNIDKMFDFPVPTSIDEVGNMYVIIDYKNGAISIVTFTLEKTVLDRHDDLKYRYVVKVHETYNGDSIIGRALKGVSNRLWNEEHKNKKSTRKEQINENHKTHRKHRKIAEQIREEAPTIVIVVPTHKGATAECRILNLPSRKNVTGVFPTDWEKEQICRAVMRVVKGAIAPKTEFIAKIQLYRDDNKISSGKVMFYGKVHKKVHRFVSNLQRCVVKALNDNVVVRVPILKVLEETDIYIIIETTKAK